MTRAKLKNLILSLCIAFTMLLGVNMTTLAYAESSVITSRDTSAWGNALGTTQATTHTVATGEFSFVIPEEEQTSTIAITLFDSDGNEYTNVTSLGDGEVYDNQITLDGNSLVDMIQYNNSSFAVFGIVNDGVPELGTFSFQYQATVTRADTTTYTTDTNTIFVTFYREGIKLSQTSLTVNQGSSLPSEATLRSYITEAYLNNTQVDTSLITIDTSSVQTNTLGTYYILYSYTVDEDEISSSIEVTVQKDLSDFELNFYYNSQTITGSASSPYNFGEVSITDDIILTVQSNDAEVLLDITASFNQEGFNISTVAVDSTTTQVQILPPKGFNSIVQGTLTVSSYTYNIGEQALVFDIKYNIDTSPVITFTTEDEITFNKKCSLEELADALRQLVDSIVDYDGSKVAYEDIQDVTKLIISHNVTDTSISGEYQATYQYTSQLSGLTTTVNKTFYLINEVPTIDSYTVKANSATITNGTNLQPGTVVEIEVTASDLDADSIQLIVESSTGSVVQDQTNKSLFTFTPNSKYIGTVTFTIYCKDSEHQSSEQSIFSVTYVDATNPTLTFTSSVVNTSGVYNLHVDKNTIIYFGQMIAQTNDNIDTLTEQDVTLVASGFNLDSLNRAIFTITGNYSVTYTITDKSGNSTSYLVNVLVNNSAPVATDVDGGIHTYGKQVEIDLNNYVQDTDNDTLTFYRDGVVFDQDDNTVVTDYYDIDMLTGKLTLRPTAKYLGTIKLQYHATDIDGKNSQIKYIYIQFIDNIAPVITRTDLRSDFVTNKSQGYDKYGFFTAVDEIDGDNITTTLTITDLSTNQKVDDIDFTKIGSYRFDYSFKDQSANSLPATASLTVNVTNGSKPEIILRADSAKVEQGTRFSIFDYIYQIVDAEDGTKESGFADMYNSGSLKLSKIPNTETVGKVVVSMYYVDSDGNLSDTITFTLVVEAPATISPYYFIAGAAAIVLIIAISLIIIFVRRSKMRI